jgi:hypothetical protein
MGKILIGNKHWGAIHLHIDRPKDPNTPFVEWEITVPGTANIQGQAFGYIEADEDGFIEWLRTHQDQEMVKNDVIFKLKPSAERALRAKAAKQGINLVKGYPHGGQPFIPSFKSGNN